MPGEPFLVRWTFAMDGCEPDHDETVVSDLPALFAIEKGIVLLGVHGTIRVEFDPPLIPRYATGGEG